MVIRCYTSSSALQDALLSPKLNFSLNFSSADSAESRSLSSARRASPDSRRRGTSFPLDMQRSRISAASSHHHPRLPPFPLSSLSFLSSPAPGPLRPGQTWRERERERVLVHGPQSWQRISQRRGERTISHNVLICEECVVRLDHAHASSCHCHPSLSGAGRASRSGVTRRSRPAISRPHSSSTTRLVKHSVSRLSPPVLRSHPPLYANFSVIFFLVCPRGCSA